MVDLDEEDYMKGVEELQHSVVRHLFFQKGKIVRTTLDLKNKLWRFGMFHGGNSFLWGEAIFMLFSPLLMIRVG